MKFTHLRDDSGQLFATVAEHNNGEFGASICSEHDQFSRKIGRNIAGSRAERGHDYVPESPRQVCVYGQLQLASDVVFNFIEDSQHTDYLADAASEIPF